MPIENPEVLKRALAIIDRERSNLKFQASKLVTLTVNDYTFTTSFKRACPDKMTGAALLGRLRTNPNALLNLNGVQALKMRLAQRINEDVAVLRRVAERILAATKEVAPPAHEKRIVSPGHGIPTTVRVDVPAAYDIIVVGIDAVSHTFSLVMAGGMVAMLAPWAEGAMYDAIFGVYSAELMKCYLAADAIYEQCQFAATSQRLPNREQERRCARCMSDLLTRAAACLSSPPRKSFPWGDLPRYLQC
jgi:hypothetical protein